MPADDETQGLPGARGDDPTRAVARPSRREPTDPARADDVTREVGRASDQLVTRDALPALGGPTPGGPRHGAELGGHRLGAELGRGGMGVVYRAEHLATGAVRAVKVLLAPERSPEAERFRREGQAMAAVDGHPNVLRVHAAGEAPGALWLSMDLAAGGSLEQRVERLGPRPSDEVARLGAALARGLAHVHAHGVLHRDLKPANVLFDERGRPLLVDFGLARVSGSERLTESGAIVGTPRYMAPEQVLADRGLEVDERTDVFGLGAVLYHALTGAPPADGQDTGDILRRVIDTPPTPPSRRAANVSPALEAVLLRCLEKRPARRYPTARALADDLEAVAAGRAPAALARRRRDPVTPLLAAASALVALVLAHQLLRTPPGPPPLPPPVDLLAPATSEEALARLDDLLAREDEAGALATLEATLERAREEPLAAPRLQELAPRLFAALLGAPTPTPAEAEAALARWAARGPALLDAARAARAFDDERASRAALSAVPGAAPVALALLDVRSAQRAADPFSSARAGELLGPLDQAVARAEEAAQGPVGAALRLRVQRAVAAADAPLLRASRADPAPVLALLARARLLAPGSRAAEALHITAGLVAWKARGGEPPHLPASLDGARLAARYAPQQVDLEAFRVIGAARDEPGIAAGLAAWGRLREACGTLGLLDARGEFGADVVVPVDLSPHADLMLRAYETVGTLLLWSAWLSRGRPDFSERAAVALERAEAVRRTRPAVGSEQVLRVHLLLGDVAAARTTLRDAVNDAGLEDWILRCLEADLALLEGDVERARRGLARVLERVGDAQVRAQVLLWAAAAEAEAGALAQAEANFARAAKDLDPSTDQLVVPWRTLPATRLALDRARSGWRVARTGRLHPE